MSLQERSSQDLPCVEGREGKEMGERTRKWERGQGNGREDEEMGERTRKWERGQGNGREDREMGERARKWEGGQGNGREDEEMGERTRKWERGRGNEREDKEMGERTRKWERGRGNLERKLVSMRVRVRILHVQTRACERSKGSRSLHKNATWMRGRVKLEARCEDWVACQSVTQLHRRLT
eukprot:363957-Chlamydomonas_euryale.AAC.4